jgi:hypothetical protein
VKPADPTVFALLRALVDGERSVVTRDEAKVVHAALWDARSAVAAAEQRAESARARAAELDAENVKLVRQVVVADLRAEAQAAEIDELRDRLRRLADAPHNPKRERAAALRLLGSRSTPTAE